MLLCLSLLVAAAPMALAAETTPQLSLTAQWDQGTALVTLSVQNAESVSNGRIILNYPECAVLEDTVLLAPVGMHSISDDLSLSWVGSDFSENQPLLQLRFAPAEDMTVGAQAPELFAGETALTAESAVVAPN